MSGEPALVLRRWNGGVGSESRAGRLHGTMPALGFQALSLFLVETRSPSCLFVATRFHLVDSARSKTCCHKRPAKRTSAGCQWFAWRQPSGAATGRLPGHLRSLGGSSKSLGMMVSHVRRGALTAHFGVRGARPRPTAMEGHARKTAWHDAMLSTSGRRPAKKKQQDAVFFVSTDTCARWAARRNR